MTDPRQDPDPIETREWRESLDEVLERAGPERVRQLIHALRRHAYARGVTLPFSANTPFVNTIGPDRQPHYPGDRELERRIKSIIRWNAMAMVVRANKEAEGIGGHISSYASAATLLEVGFNHFFRARNESFTGDMIYFQGHGSPGIYARAFLEGRINEEQMAHFRREMSGGLASYPHPWLMPDFWQFPTVSMGLGPIQSIYQARFSRYLEDRGLKDADDARVWCFVGDGETDEPETLGAIGLAARERLDNLIWVINCNLQRLDGPVRGNGKIIQELEADFRGTGWNVIKVVWGSEWDELLARDETGLLMRRMDEIVDGEQQKYSVEGGDYIRKHFFGKYPELLKLVEHLSDDYLHKMRRGGHDPEKVYAAFKAAVEHKGAPSVILAQTIKGYGLGEAGEGRNITHQQKKLNEDELREFRTRFKIPIDDEAVAKVPFYRPPDDSPEIQYLQQRRKALGGYVPERKQRAKTIEPVEPEIFREFHEGTAGREVSTTMAFVRMLTKLMKHERIGKYVTPIVPDEARTFGMESLFRQFGIYSRVGQLYEPVDSRSLLYYKEARDGQIIEEGITEAGSMCSFIAAGTAYANLGLQMIPFFTFYSMFGFQRIGDLIWAAGDQRARGFMMGGTAGRTTLNGEGLQHEDGHSHLLAYPLPNLLAYDPAYAYEMAVIIEEGIDRMFARGEDVFYYITMYNENYAQPAMPEGAREGILKGMYRLRESPKAGAKLHANLLGSGPILPGVAQAAELLEDKYGVACDVWSVTSYKELHRDAIATARWNMLHPRDKARVPYVTECLSQRRGVTVASSDYVRALPESIGRHVPGRFVTLGTDGFGRSDTRSALRDFFEVDYRWVTIGTLSALAADGKIEADAVAAAMTEMGIDPERGNPVTR
ncbi:pyruvate dehydrogenase (acetyl-transferring), homodimeric type [bacterium]|nr:pyruvate dehydrogenase (acetyl-transferring), homodimeric type [bacterium]